MQHEGLEYYPFPPPKSPEMAAYVWDVSVDQAKQYLAKLAAETMLTTGIMFQVFMPDDHGGVVEEEGPADRQVGSHGQDCAGPVVL